MAQVQPQLDTAVAEAAAVRARQVLDGRVEDSLSWPRFIARQFASSSLGRATRIGVSSNRECLQVLVLRRDVKNTPTVTKIPALPKGCDVSIQIDRRLLAAVPCDSLVLAVGTTILTHFLDAESAPNSGSFMPPAFSARHSEWRFTGSADGQQVVVSHVDRRGGSATPAKLRTPSRSQRP